MSRYSSHFRLFGGSYGDDLTEIKESRLSGAGSQRRNSTIEKLPDISKEDFIDRGMTEVGLDIPEFDFDKLRHEEVGSVGAERLKYKLYVRGNVELLHHEPEQEVEEITFTLDGAWLTWNVNVTDREKEEVEQEVEEKLQKLQRGLNALYPELEAVNEKIEEKLEAVYEERIGACLRIPHYPSLDIA